MATNKHAQIRYKVLDTCFRNSGRNYTFNDLMDAVNDALAEFDPTSGGIGVRTLREDIAFMESDAGWSADIERVPFGRKAFYRYSDPNFSINNQPLNSTELSQLKTVIEMISRFSGMPQFAWVNEMVTKLNNGFKLVDKGSDIISFDSNQYLRGIEFLGELFNAIYNKKTLSIKYRSFKSDKEQLFILHPHYLKQYNNRWFLFGLNENLNTITNLALDRIINFEVSKIKYKKSNIDYDDYFEDIIGVTKPQDGKLIKIELLFNNNEAPYILTKPLHGSQVNKRHDENGLYLTIEVIPNKELEKLILSFGDRVKVLGPKKMVNLFKFYYQNSLKQY